MNFDFNALRSEKEREIERQLMNPISFQFENKPLKRVLEEIGDVSGINIVPDVRALNEKGISLDLPMTQKLEGISVKSALSILLDQANLTYVIKDEVVTVTTPERVRGGIDSDGRSAEKNLQRLSIFDVGSDARNGLLYQRPSYTGEDRFFFDLVSLLPRHEHERGRHPRDHRGGSGGGSAFAAGQDRPSRAAADRSRPCRRLAHLHAAATAGRDAIDITFDNSGRFTYERVIPPGLRERVICDGKTMLHLYPDLGIAARRDVSRFHRQEFAGLVPWAVPPAEDLARGADLRAIADRVVEIVPHGPADISTACTPISSSASAASWPNAVSSSCRQNHTLVRWLFDADGTIRTVNRQGNEVAALKGRLKPAAAPELTRRGEGPGRPVAAASNDRASPQGDEGGKAARGPALR